MKWYVNIGRVWGIPVVMYWSGLLLYLIFVVVLTKRIQIIIPGLSGVAYWGIGITVILLALMSLMAHELGHAVVAIHNHVPIQHIAIDEQGGFLKFIRDPEMPDVSLRIVSMGPVMNGVLALVFLGFHFVTWNVPVLNTVALWMFLFNLSMGLLNMIPIFPFDGGRMLHAVIWMRRSHKEATNILTKISAIGWSIIVVVSVILLRGWM